MTSWPSALVAVLLLAAGPAGAQTLYLGKQELDTSDRRQVAGVLERCARLAADAGDAGASAAFTWAGQAGEAGRQGEGETGGAASSPVSGRADSSNRQEHSAAAPARLTLGVEAAASSGDESEAAGEGTGAFAGPSELGGDEGGGDASPAVDLAQVTLHHCKEAGLVY